MQSKYVVGVDFGTLSARALIVDVTDGRELGVGEHEYSHAVMDEALPDGTRLPQDWALQFPADYIQSMGIAVRSAIAESGISAEDIIGVGMDFTACTLIAVDAAGQPLCDLPEYASNPHSYVKLWKHHAAQDEANRINQLAAARGESFLSRYGGKISSEWLLPKVWQTLNEAPEIYEAADKFMEVADWMVFKLTGNVRRNSCTAGYKALWSKREGYPGKEFLRELDARLENLVEDKLSGDIYPLGYCAGTVTKKAAQWSGLPEGAAVAVANVDAHVSLPAVGITSPGEMLMIMGTSTCHMVMGDEEKIVPGMCGAVEDGMIPGYIGFEAGQSCVGDHFAWFADTLAPENYENAARKRGISVQQLLTEKAEAQKPGEHGLLALDWWNGNRSVLVDADLTGMLLGMTLQTKPEDIYRALIEATAYGTRMIIQTLMDNGVAVDKLFACGGIAEKNPMLMQIYSDVTRMEIRIGASAQSPALGSAMFGAVAAGAQKGGYADIKQAALKMGGVKDIVYAPNLENAAIYDKLYAEYAKLHDYFGRGGNDVMKRLKEIKGDAVK